MTRILILGGTGEARVLADVLTARGFEVVSSLAGVTTDPALPNGEVRKGGFGGAEGLRAYLDEAGIGIIADATHPFAATISRHAAEAAAACRLAYVRLERPAWCPEPGERWREVADAAAAAAAVPAGATVLLTIGHKGLVPFAARSDISVVARMIEPPRFSAPAGWRFILARPPFTLEQERQLMVAEGVSVLVSKNAGGEATRAKLVAARELGVAVIMIARPVKPPAETADSVEAMVEIVAAKADKGCR